MIAACVLHRHEPSGKLGAAPRSLFFPEKHSICSGDNISLVLIWKSADDFLISCCGLWHLYRLASANSSALEFSSIAVASSFVDIPNLCHRCSCDGDDC